VPRTDQVWARRAEAGRRRGQATQNRGFRANSARWHLFSAHSMQARLGVHAVDPRTRPARATGSGSGSGRPSQVALRASRIPRARAPHERVKSGPRRTIIDIRTAVRRAARVVRKARSQLSFSIIGPRRAHPPDADRLVPLESGAAFLCADTPPLSAGLAARTHRQAQLHNATRLWTTTVEARLAHRPRPPLISLARSPRSVGRPIKAAHAPIPRLAFDTRGTARRTHNTLARSLPSLALTPLAPPTRRRSPPPFPPARAPARPSPRAPSPAR